MKRRDFLKKAAGVTAAAAGLGGLTGILSARRAPAYAQRRRLRILRWNDFIAQADEVLKAQAAEASRALGADVTFEFVNVADLQARITAAIQSGSGPDIVLMLWAWPQLYANALVDVSDVAEPIGRVQGGFYDIFQATARSGDRWLAMPHSVGGFFPHYRRSWHAEVGAAEFPKTWDEWREVGRRLKARGKPVGQSLGHGLDASTFSYPLLWSFGGAEVDATGKRVVLNSRAAVESVRFLQAFWQEACDPSGLAWDDTANNRAFLAGELSATANGLSVYIVAKRQQNALRDERGQPLYQDIETALMPAGPAGQFHLNTPFQHAVMRYSQNQRLAKEFLRWMHRREVYERWFTVNEGYSVGPARVWEEHPMWTRIDRPMQTMRRATRMSLMIGHPAPASARATEAYSKYIVVDMYAKAAQGMRAEDAVRWAEGELKKIYET
ncbi:MAG: extracellular solute-binding protein [Armatimonadota bacterium]|nr:extracellular solute-binding protein [Armatimonadota bacterium]